GHSDASQPSPARPPAARSTSESVAAALPNFPPVAAPLPSAWTPVETIQPFVPHLESSEFHQRLKAVVKAGFSLS
ncbi:MAG TPA: hypothetical protein IGR64_11815, partial [Leptolyngbyaceae cyanobacterium M65_K2018_010]|nr:hypothetical protein [Leptolyngbyaceae cyanobacterium M65_K2018_010]